MGCLERSVGELHHIEHVSGESETVAELVEDDAAAHDPQVGRLGDGHVQIDRARKCQAESHRPQGFLQPDPGGIDSADDASGQEGDHSESAIDHPVGIGGETQSSFRHRIFEERIQHIH